MFRESPFTYIFGGISLLIPILTYCQLISPYDIYYNRDRIFCDYQFYRLFTSLFQFGSLSFSTLLYFLTFMSYVKEDEAYFATKPADFLIFCFFGFIALWIYSALAPLLFLASGLMSYFIYYFAKRSPDQRIRLFTFPIPIPAGYMPVALVAIHLWYREFSEMPPTLVAYFAAHVYFFVKDVIGLRFDLNLLTAPASANRALNRLFGRN
jgi:membrane associated rhomboid family serine protease